MPRRRGRFRERQLRGRLWRLLRGLPQRLLQRRHHHEELHLRHQPWISSRQNKSELCNRRKDSTKMFFFSVSSQPTASRRTPPPAPTSTKRSATTCATSGWTLTDLKSGESRNGVPICSFLPASNMHIYVCSNANFANRGQCTLDEFDFFNVSFFPTSYLFSMAFAHVHMQAHGGNTPRLCGILDGDHIYMDAEFGAPANRQQRRVCCRLTNKWKNLFTSSSITPLCQYA